MIRRPPRSTLSSSSAASDVYKRQDHPTALPTLDKSLAQNSEHLANVLTAQPLDWTDPTAPEKLEPPFDVLLAADVVWVQELIVPLVATMNSLSGANTVIYFAYQSRSQIADQTLFTALTTAKFAWSVVPDHLYHDDFSSAKILIYEIVRS
eukprot:TRINITY_DN49668_c0_g1_i2.p1 TRINITY_DN49668_c0_g1~~TRINITY_DN49668_c0_g1_i2.p1  ORF type:complete len:151 (+),score=9.97 TRINITY_DN49668_c0_g1_i2:67-519(+)